MSRAKPQSSKINNIHEANQTLREIALLQDDLARIDTEADRKIAKIKEDAVKKGEQGRKRIVELEQGLALFAEYNKTDLFPEKRSAELSYGRFGFHRSTRISIKTKPAEKSTLYLLKTLFPKKAIRVKEEVDKEELKDWPDEKLAQINAKKVQNDNFYYEIDREQVNQDMLVGQKIQ